MAFVSAERIASVAVVAVRRLRIQGVKDLMMSTKYVRWASLELGNRQINLLYLMDLEQR
jgi:hypothetical protein